jgi:acyl-coenzyme A synthetase/AMP-(fatty) acid ligase
VAHVAAISHADAADTLAYRGARRITAAQFLADVERIAAQLPQRRHLVNLCADRYRFTVGLTAALLRGQVSLLPPNQTPDLLGELLRDYPDVYALGDSAPQSGVLEHVFYREEMSGESKHRPLRVPSFAEGQVAAIAFTSGSTGVPTPHPKTWGALARGARAEFERFAPQLGNRACLVGTVPAQHMFGLESTVLLALRNGLALHAGRPFYPADVATALAQVQGERVLVTTPVHLRVLLNENIPLPELKLIICATAPLSPQMAAQVEERYHAPLHEVYGFTEAGMVATRRTVLGAAWHCLAGLKLRRDGAAHRISGGHVEQEVAFSDVIESSADTVFLLQGRNADLVNIAGKRTSLAHLNHHLTSIEGVHDGAFLMPEENGDGVTRLTAFVVAPGVESEDVLRALRLRIDAVFLPRPLYLVEALPRNATGKLPREALLRLAQICAGKSAEQQCNE